MVVGASLPSNCCTCGTSTSAFSSCGASPAIAKVSVRVASCVLSASDAPRSANVIFWPGTEALRSVIFLDVLLSL